MTRNLIQLDRVRLSLTGAAGKVEILKGIDLNIGTGESVAILGPSGSGKSTLLAALGGLEAITSGDISVAGKDLKGMGEDELALFRRENVAIVFQSFHLLPTMTAIENVSVPLELAGKPDPFARAEKELATVGLLDRIHHYPSQLSGGEQQRVALARAIASDPRLILADEPTGNLDGETGDRVIEQLFTINRDRNVTLLLVTHDEGLAARCGRVVRLRDGMIVSDSAHDAEPERVSA